MNSLKTILGMIETEAVQGPQPSCKDYTRVLEDIPYNPINSPETKEEITIDFKLELIKKKDGSYALEE